ncbi:RNA-binding protein 5 [Aspergillus brasiliensis]|uniref:RNA-binding protein 5 n=1 Tax=Aspergillus brasiliensis TaxID=319629 RepID=A0A9W5YIB5_9EURO|nr:RNA-binding protein 5 [Aspergillus brasiliensis]
MRPGIRLVHHTDLCPAVTTGTAACTTIVRPPDRARLAISHARLPVGLRRTEDPNTPETESTTDPVTAVGIAMTFDGAHRARLPQGGEDQPTGIATVRAIAPQDTTVGAEATVAAAAAVLAVADNRISDTKAER